MSWRPITDWKPIRDEVVKTALEMILDIRCHPILIIDPYVLLSDRWRSGVVSRRDQLTCWDRLGIHHNGIVVGCLRRMQCWNFASILVEVTFVPCKPTSITLGAKVWFSVSSSFRTNKTSLLWRAVHRGLSPCHPRKVIMSLTIWTALWSWNNQPPSKELPTSLVELW